MLNLAAFSIKSIISDAHMKVPSAQIAQEVPNA